MRTPSKIYNIDAGIKIKVFCGGRYYQKFTTVAWYINHQFNTFVILKAIDFGTGINNLIYISMRRATFLRNKTISDDLLFVFHKPFGHCEFIKRNKSHLHFITDSKEYD